MDARTSSRPDRVRRPHADGRRAPRSLLWRLFVADGAVLIVAFLLLALTPVTISAEVSVSQVAVLLVGLTGMLVLNLVLLRRVLAPLLKLTDLMTSIDPDRPGRRLSGVEPHSAEGVALVEAFNGMLDRLETARREAARTALVAQEAERLRVARELHDEIGQTLTAITLQAERAAGGDAGAAPRELGRVADAVRDSLDEVRRIARELRPEALDDLGLVSALIALCSRVDAPGGPRIRQRLQTNLPPLPPDVELVIYRVVQEAVTNALRHAGATTITVSLEADTGSVTASVTDDGVGMPSQLRRDTAGIAGMRERALLVDARLSFEPRAGGGTIVRLVVPLERDA